MALRDIWQYILHDLGWAAAVGYDRHTMPHHEDEEESFIREVEEVLWRDRAREEGRVRERPDALEGMCVCGRPSEDMLLRSAESQEHFDKRPPPGKGF